LDAEKKAEGLKFHDKLYDLTKKIKECSFQEIMIRNRIHIYKDNTGQLAVIKKDAETGADPHNIKALCVIQSIKSGVIPENMIEKELTTVMAVLSPSAVAMAEGGSGEGNEAKTTKKLSKHDQDRMAEAGRMAIKYDLIALCEGACNVISRSTQGSLRAKIWTEYNKAELTLKKKSKLIDPATGMKLNLQQQQDEEFERRVEALKILERAMIANRRLADSDVIIEGCVLIWNTAIPLLKSSTRHHVYKPFTSASNMLETIQANESKLRVCLYLELAKFEIEQDFISKAEEQIKKAMLIDYSLSKDKLQIQLQEDEEAGDFQREFERVLTRIKKCIDLRLNIYGEPDTQIDQMILDVENAKSTNNSYLIETLIDKVLQQLIEYSEPEFELTDEEEKEWTDDRKSKEEIKFKKSILKEKKQRMLLASEISELAFDTNLIELAFEAGNLAVKVEWDPRKDTDIVISQCKAHYIVAQCYVEMLLEEEIEIGFNDLITIAEDQDEREFNEEDTTKYQGWKTKFVQHIQEGVKLAMSTLQPALIFRGTIIFWNNYLPIFKRLDYYDVVNKDAIPVMQECFEGMNNTFVTTNFGAGNIDYNLNTKLSVFTNFSHIYCRIQEKTNQDETLRVCNLLLEKNLPPHLRKAFDTMKTRITKQAKAPDKAAPSKGKGEPAAQEFTQTEIIAAEVIGLLELIATNLQTDTTAAFNMIKDAMDKLTPWMPNDKEEIELELHAELWCRLGRLSILLKTTPASKVALF
jgi:hypothetical protein